MKDAQITARVAGVRDDIVTIRLEADEKGRSSHSLKTKWFTFVQYARQKMVAKNFYKPKCCVFVMAKPTYRFLKTPVA